MSGLGVKLRTPATILALLLVVAFVGCDDPSRSDDVEWPKINGFRQATLPGATGFRAQYRDLDNPSFIFSYHCPLGTTSETAFRQVKSVFENHFVHSETKRILQLRHVHGGGSGQRAGVTLIFNPLRLVMTVLLINQKDCLHLHSWLLNRATHWHQEFGGD